MIRVFYEGLSKIRRLIQLIITRYVHHTLSLFSIDSCNWNALGLAFVSRLGRIPLQKNCLSCSFSHPFAVQITFPSLKIAPWPHIIPYVFLDPLKIVGHLGIGSAVFAGLKIVTDWPTDRQTTLLRLYNNRPHLHTSEMRPNDKLCNSVVTDNTYLPSHIISMKFTMSIYTVSHKNGANLFLPVTSSKINGF